jgi:hypothetical protein
MLYQELFGRGVDSYGLEFYSSRLVEGGIPEGLRGVVRELLGSDEYRARVRLD